VPQKMRPSLIWLWIGACGEMEMAETVACLWPCDLVAGVPGERTPSVVYRFRFRNEQIWYPATNLNGASPSV
jgi:hypothetical protein